MTGTDIFSRFDFLMNLLSKSIKRFSLTKTYMDALQLIFYIDKLRKLFKNDERLVACWQAMKN